MNRAQHRSRLLDGAAAQRPRPAQAFAHVGAGREVQDCVEQGPAGLRCRGRDGHRDRTSDPLDVGMCDLGLRRGLRCGSGWVPEVVSAQRGDPHRAAVSMGAPAAELRRAGLPLWHAGPYLLQQFQSPGTVAAARIEPGREHRGQFVLIDPAQAA